MGLRSPDSLGAGRGPCHTWEVGRGSQRAPSPTVMSPQDPLPPHVPSPTVQAEDDPGQEEAITTIQSILRAHLARVRHR